MASPLTVYGLALDALADADVDWLADTIKVALVTSSYTPNQDTHDFFDDVSANEVTGTGYTAGGITLANKTRTYDTATNTLKLDADDVSWSNSTITARYAIIYKSRGGAASADELLGYLDFQSNVSSSAGPFSIAWNAAGIFTIAT